MKIPQVFMPEKNLEDKTRYFLEKKDSDKHKEHAREYFDVLINKHVVRGAVLSNNVRVGASDDLRIQVCYSQRLEIVLDMPILKEVYEKTIRNTDKARVLKEYGNAENKAKNGLKKLEKHFDFDELIVQVQNDLELLSKINEIFKDFSPGYYHFEFKEYGSVSLEGKGLFTGKHSIAVQNLYHDYLSKYIVKDTEKNGFLYRLRIGIRNLF